MFKYYIQPRKTHKKTKYILEKKHFGTICWCSRFKDDFLLLPRQNWPHYLYNQQIHFIFAKFDRLWWSVWIEITKVNLSQMYIQLFSKTFIKIRSLVHEMWYCANRQTKQQTNTHRGSHINVHLLWQPGIMNWKLKITPFM